MIGEKIKSLREQNKKTQEDLAKYLGVAPQTVYKYEKGINEPDLSTTQKIADYFGITVDELLGRIDDEFLKVQQRLKDNNIKAYTFSDIDLKKYSELDEEKRKLIAKQMNAMIDIFLEEKDKE